jgi:peptidoglycan/LPS O-acetylase OafA/YrhL
MGAGVSDLAVTALPQPSTEWDIPAQRQQSSAAGPARRSGRIRILDGFRLLAALMVMAYHFCDFSAPWGSDPARHIPSLVSPAFYGWMGVELFFIISGFVICMSSMGRTIGEFFSSRVVRLFPAYWFAVLATTAVLALWPVVQPRRDPVDVLINLTMLQQPLGTEPVDAVYWTLFAELRFYLLFALVVWRGATYRRILTFCCLWLVGSALVIGLDAPILQQLLMPAYAPFFIAGIAFFLMHRFGQNLLLWGLAGASFAFGCRQVRSAASHAADVTHFVGPQWPALALFGAFFVMMAVVSLRWVNPQWRWLTAAGALTYPLYLIHEYIGWSVIRALHDHVPPYVLVVGVAAMMIVCALLVHKLVEKPVARLLKQGLSTAFAAVRANSAGVR